MRDGKETALVASHGLNDMLGGVDFGIGKSGCVPGGDVCRGGTEVHQHGAARPGSAQIWTVIYTIYISAGGGKAGHAAAAEKIEHDIAGFCEMLDVLRNR